MGSRNVDSKKVLFFTRVRYSRFIMIPILFMQE